MKSDKMSYIIYAELKSLLKKIDGFSNNPENSSTTKIGEHIPCGCSMSTIWGFNHIGDVQTLYRKRLYEEALKFFQRTCEKCNRLPKEKK